MPSIILPDAENQILFVIGLPANAYTYVKSTLRVKDWHKLGNDTYRWIILNPQKLKYSPFSGDAMKYADDVIRFWKFPKDEQRCNWYQTEGSLKDTVQAKVNSLFNPGLKETDSDVDLMKMP